MASKGQPKTSVADGFLMPVEDYRSISYGYSGLTDYDHAAAYRTPLEEQLGLGSVYSIYMTQIVPGGSYGFGDGLVGTPSVFFQNDQDCGLYRIGNDRIGMAVGGVKVTEWNASGGSFYIPTMTTGSVLFAGASGLVSQNNASFFWDNTNNFLSLLGTTGKQLRLSYDTTHNLDLRCLGSETINGNVFTNNVTLSPTGTADGFFSFWRIQGSDFCFSYTGTIFRGQGVPNVTISGPPNTGTYTKASGPGLNFQNELAGVDNKTWTFFVHDETLTFRTINDADNASADWLSVTRNAMAFTYIFFPNAAPVGVHTSTPRAQLDILNTGALNQLRLTHTDNSVYTNFDTDSSGNLSVLGTGGKCGIQASATAGFGSLQVVNSAAAYNSESNAALSLRNTSTSPNKVVNMGYDNTNDIGFIYSVHSATAVKPFMINTTAFGVNTITPRKMVDIKDTAAAQLRLTYTDNSVYADLLLNSSGELYLTPTSGIIAFGTRSAIGAETVTGYITIKDAGGTTRKLAVVS